MKNFSNTIEVRFEVQPQDCWNARTNEPYKGYALVRYQGNQGWTMGKFACWHTANEVREQMEQIRERELNMGWDIC